MPLLFSYKKIEVGVRDCGKKLQFYLSSICYILRSLWRCCFDARSHVDRCRLQKESDTVSKRYVHLLVVRNLSSAHAK